MKQSTSPEHGHPNIGSEYNTKIKVHENDTRSGTDIIYKYWLVGDKRNISDVPKYR